MVGPQTEMLRTCVRPHWITLLSAIHQQFPQLILICFSMVIRSPWCLRYQRGCRPKPPTFCRMVVLKNFGPCFLYDQWPERLPFIQDIGEKGLFVFSRNHIVNL